MSMHGMLQVMKQMTKKYIHKKLWHPLGKKKL